MLNVATKADDMSLLWAAKCGAFYCGTPKTAADRFENVFTVQTFSCPEFERSDNPVIQEKANG